MAGLPTASDRAAAGRRVAALIESGLPLETYSVAESGVTVIARPLAAAMWRDRCGAFIDVGGRRVDLTVMQIHLPFEALGRAS